MSFMSYLYPFWHILYLELRRVFMKTVDWDSNPAAKFHRENCPLAYFVPFPGRTFQKNLWVNFWPEIDP
jgi:hypothetical protein